MTWITIAIVDWLIATVTGKEVYDRDSEPLWMAGLASDPGLGWAPATVEDSIIRVVYSESTTRYLIATLTEKDVYDRDCEA